MPLCFVATAGFAALFLSDFLRLRTLKGAEPSALAGYLLVAGSIAGFAAPGVREAATPDLQAAAGVLISLVFGALLLYSVFIEIPRAQKKRGLGARTALTGGTYGFSRHPGFLWFVGLMGGLLLARRGGGLPFAACLVILDFLLVLVQDVYYFPRFFENYQGYRSRVPFLLGFGRRRADGRS